MNTNTRNPKIRLRNLIRAEIQLALTPVKIFLFFYGLFFAILSSIFIIPTSEFQFLLFFSSAVILTISIAIFNILFDFVAIDRSRLAYLLYPKEVVTLTRFCVELVSLFFRLLTLFVIFLLIRARNEYFPVELGSLIIGFIKIVIPTIALYACVYIVGNLSQTLSKDTNKSRGLLALGTWICLIPVMVLSFVMPHFPPLQNWLFDNAIWIQCIPYLNFTSILFANSTDWWGSLIFTSEIALFMSLMWKRYSYRVKSFIIKTAS